MTALHEQELGAADASKQRVVKAYERLHRAWETIRMRRLTAGYRAIDGAAIHELDEAEAAWLAARAGMKNA